MTNETKGFASLHPDALKIISSKGGSAKVKKGFAMLSPEQRRENAKRAVTIRFNKGKTNEN